MITLQDSLMDVCIKLAQGNPGAASVCAKLLQDNPLQGFLSLLDMDDMGLKGPAIWVVYKDFAKQDLPTLIEALLSRSPALIAAVHKEGLEAFAGGRS